MEGPCNTFNNIAHPNPLPIIITISSYVHLCSRQNGKNENCTPPSLFFHVVLGRKKISLFTWVPQKKLHCSKSSSFFFTSTKQPNSISFHPIPFPFLSFHPKSLLPNTQLMNIGLITSTNSLFVFSIFIFI